MRIVTSSKLRSYWQGPQPRAREALDKWAAMVKAADWRNFHDVRQSDKSADLVGTCVVFNLGRNRWRLVARINYRTHIVFVLRIMTHAEYDRVDWVESCGCHRPWPVYPQKSHKASAPPEEKTDGNRKKGQNDKGDG